MKFCTFPMDIGILEVLSFLFALLLLLYYYFTWTFNFWQSRGIPGPKPTLLYGNVKEIIFGKISVGEWLKREYNNYKHEQMFGMFLGRKPILVINDPNLIQEILVKSFSSFANRVSLLFEKIEPLSPNLVNLEAKRWRPLRAKQTTMFTTVKLKEMFYLLLECADNLEKILAKMTEDNDVVECCEVTARFTTDVIGTCAFGLDMKALVDEQSEFRKVGRLFVNPNKWRAFKMRFKQIFPWLYNILGPIMYDREINDFFINSMLDTMKLRRINNIKRHDFVDLLIDLKDNPEKLEDIDLTDTLLIAQAFAFFFAGFETSSTTLSHALYELALNPTIQDKLRQEIQDELDNNGKFEFERIKNMKYLDKVFSETLRKFPVVSVLSRQATQPYTFSTNQLKIPKNTIIFISTYGIHSDPKYYPNPDVFDPERFNEDIVKERHPFHYLPFGAGPRNCIAARFGNYQTKVGLITILKNYQISISEKTPIPYTSNKRRFLLAPASGIYLKFTKLL